MPHNRYPSGFGSGDNTASPLPLEGMAKGQLRPLLVISSFPRKRESSGLWLSPGTGCAAWIPAFAGMTTLLRQPSWRRGLGKEERDNQGCACVLPFAFSPTPSHKLERGKKPLPHSKKCSLVALICDSRHRIGHVIGAQYRRSAAFQPLGNGGDAEHEGVGSIGCGNVLFCFRLIQRERGHAVGKYLHPIPASGS